MELIMLLRLVFLPLLSSVFAFATAYSQEVAPPPEQELPFKKIIFRVLDIKTNAPLALGVETIEVTHGKITKNTDYFTAGKSRDVIQSESATTDLKNLTISEYKFKNSQTGEQVELLMPSPPLARLKYTAKTNDKPENFEYRWSSQTVVGKTLHHYIVRNWANLLGGKSPEFELFVPMKRDHFKFRVRRDRDVKLRDLQAHVISLEPSNWAIRALVPRMDFFYTVKSGIPVLVRYEGATTVAINGDDKKEVAIEFEYES
jgi:hypothetical protein